MVGDLPINFNNINLQKCVDFMMGLLHLSSDFELLNFLVAEENEAEEEEGEKKEEEEKEEEKEEESISVGEVLLPPSPLEYPVKEISQLFNTINELNLDIHLLSILTIRQEKEEEDGKGEDAEKVRILIIYFV